MEHILKNLMLKLGVLIVPAAAADKDQGWNCKMSHNCYRERTYYELRLRMPTVANR